MLDLDVSTSVLSVLIIEDQEDIATSLKMFLELAAGHQVTVAMDGEAGIAAALSHQPDAVVCDIGLPKKNGLEVAGVLNAMVRRPLLIACSAYSDDVMVARGKTVGFDHFLCKPADPRKILEILEDHHKTLDEARGETGL